MKAKKWADESEERGEEDPEQYSPEFKNRHWLKWDVARLKEENAFLNKAAAYFTKEPK